MKERDNIEKNLPNEQNLEIKTDNLQIENLSKEQLQKQQEQQIERQQIELQEQGTEQLQKKENTMQKEQSTANDNRKKFFSTSNITKIAMFAALATVAGFIKFPVPFLPSFLQFNLADFFFVISAFCLGTTAGSIVVVIKVLFSLFSSSSGYIGELADLLCGLALVLPAGLIYTKFKSLKAAIWACFAAIIATTVVGILCNWLFLVPLYAKLYTWGGLIAPVQAVFSLLHLPITVTENNFNAVYLPICVLPFNLLRSIFATGITLLVYKKLAILLQRF